MEADIAEARRKAEATRRAVETARLALETAENEVQRLEASCQHIWDIKYTPDYREAYTIPGDPPGTMGVDWRGPTYVPAETTKKWTRQCKRCGKLQTTVRTKKVNESGRIPGTSAEVEVPDFGDADRRW